MQGSEQRPGAAAEAAVQPVITEEQLEVLAQKLQAIGALGNAAEVLREVSAGTNQFNNSPYTDNTAVSKTRDGEYVVWESQNIPYDPTISDED